MLWITSWYSRYLVPRDFLVLITSLFIVSYIIQFKRFGIFFLLPAKSVSLLMYPSHIKIFLFIILC